MPTSQHQCHLFGHSGKIYTHIQYCVYHSSSAWSVEYICIPVFVCCSSACSIFCEHALTHDPVLCVLLADRCDCIRVARLSGSCWPSLFDCFLIVSDHLHLLHPTCSSYFSKTSPSRPTLSVFSLSPALSLSHYRRVHLKPFSRNVVILFFFWLKLKWQFVVFWGSYVSELLLA